MNTRWICAVTWALLAVVGVFDASTPAVAQTPESPLLTPYGGDSGYQEIVLSADSWYVAFHGNRRHSMTLVESAWLARSAQLCSSIRKQYFVELRYVGERVKPDDPAIAQMEDDALSFQRVAGFIYIPIFTPNRQTEVTPIVTPSKMAPIRCLSSADTLTDKTRALSVAESLAAAKTIGVGIP